VARDGRIKTLVEAVRARRSLKLECCDCREKDGMARIFARAFFAAPHLLDVDSKTEPGITMCFNALSDAEEVEEALAHELIHAYDHCVFERDLTDCEQLACSEIRAAREAECKRGFGNIAKTLLCRDAMGLNPENVEFDSRLCQNFKEQCVMKYARKSVSAIFPGRARSCVESQMRRCFQDIAPFQ